MNKLFKSLPRKGKFSFLRIFTVIVFVFLILIIYEMVTDWEEFQADFMEGYRGGRRY